MFFLIAGWDVQIRLENPNVVLRTLAAVRDIFQAIKKEDPSVLL
jgi:hypothetical protein